MELQEIEVTIGPDGKVMVQVRGAHGTKCLELTKELEEALGGNILERIMTPEALEEEQPRLDEDQHLSAERMSMQDQTIRLHHFEPSGRVNGPGLRAVIWVQGCALGCPGCFNPETHVMTGGEIWPVEKLVERILENSTRPGDQRIEGLTLSGGEPLHQHRAL